MGRKKGSLNKNRKQIVMKKKRGRPKNVVKIEPPPEPVKTKISKFKGYCPKCLFMISKDELVSKFVFECPSCGKRGRIKILKKVRPTLKTYKNEREYIASTINVDHHDMPAMNDPDISPKELKIQDI